MGVHGLWRLIDASGKPVPLETLENKVLAVDTSIWLYQAIKGFQDSGGRPMPNAHLLTIYHRICKLLFFKIKPVFVFDGGVPVLKKETIARRNQSRSKWQDEADKIQKQLLDILIKHTAVKKVLSNKIEEASVSTSLVPSVEDRLNKTNSSLSDGDDDYSSSSETTDSSPTKQWDLHTVDVNSTNFRSLPADVRHEILTELKETRKQSSWGRIHELPKQSDDFSSYQMNRLLKRQAVQEALEAAENEMGGHSLSLGELEVILKDQGVIKDETVGCRIASDENVRYLYIKNVEKTLQQDAKKQISDLDNIPEETVEDEQFEEDLDKAIALSLKEYSMKFLKSSDPKKSDNCNEEYEPQPSTSKKSFDGDVKTTSHKVQTYLSNLQNRYSESSDSESEMNIPKMTKPGLSESNFKQILTEVNLSKSQEVADKNEITTIDNSSSSNSDDFVEITKPELISSERNEQQMLNEVSRNKKVSQEIIDKNDNATADNNSSSSDSDDLVEVTIDDNADDVSDIFSEDDFIIDRVLTPDKSKEEIKRLSEDVTNKPLNDSHLNPNRFSEIDAINTIGRNTNEEAEVLAKNNKNVFPQDEDKGEPVEINVATSQSINNTSYSVSSEKISDIHRPAEEINCNESELESVTCSTVSKKAESTTKESYIETKKPVTQDDLHVMEQDLQKEKTDLLKERMDRERLASNITDQMYKETQELLQIFGIPYVVAPMEAEAQCAFLEQINLTNGTITDDSDIWLFGGKTVYKNFFNKSKYVLEFKADVIQRNFKLSRQQMILLALLVGSDYTSGIQGVGPVTALEILASFPPSKASEDTTSVSPMELVSGLTEFRNWFTKGKSEGKSIGIQKIALRGKLKNLSFSANFPSIQVVQAYLDPEVETTDEPFSWGKPDKVALIEFAKEKFGWTQKKSEEILNPVIKRLEERKLQRSMKDFFSTKYKMDLGVDESKISKRVRTAIDYMDPDLKREELSHTHKKATKRVRKTKNNKQETSENSNKDIADSKDRVICADTDALEFEASIELPKRIRKTKNNRQETSENSNKDIADSKDRVICADTDAFEFEAPIEPPKRIRKTNKSRQTTSAIGSQKDANKAESSKASVEATKSDIAVQPKTTETDDVLDKIQKIRNRRKIIKPPKCPVDQKIIRKKEPKKPPDIDKDEQFVKDLINKSERKTEKIIEQVQAEISKSVQSSKPRPNIPSKASSRIPQREQEKSDLLKNKLKAIELYRKSKFGPGYVKKRQRKRSLPKEDAGLSESSSDSEV